VISPAERNDIVRIAVLSDIHGNCVALDAALADLDRFAADAIVCLGDAIQGGPQPGQVAARLRDLNCPVVMGNADAWLLNGVRTGNEPTSPERERKVEAVREWSLSHLSADDQNFIADFQPPVEVSLPAGRRLLCFHGSPAWFDDILLPETAEDEFQQLLGGYTACILTGGHTHIQHIRRLADTFYFNPGSVGFAYNRVQAEESFRADPWAEYAVLSADNERLGLEFRRVPFDTAELIRAYRESERPFADEAIAQYR
jgi:predicted phosphodiesterase